MSQIWGSPCLVEGKIYLGDQDGDVAMFELSPKLKLLAKNAMGDAVYSTPTVAGDVLYISTSTHLIAVGRGQGPEVRDQGSAQLDGAAISSAGP
jgi:hypothetical protein